MKPNTRVYLILLAGFAVLLAACQFPVRSPARVEQITSTPPQVESPLPVVTEGLLLDSASAYRVTLHSEVRRTQPDGSTIPEILEYNYFWTRSENPYGYNEHRVTTIVDPLSGTPGVMDEAYVVDDLAFTYCPTCPMITAGQTGWSVGKRSGGDSPGSARDVYVDGVSTIAGMPLAALVARSVVIGSEEISGIPATHYRLTDSQVLSEMVRIRTGGAPNTPLEVRMAQANIWLTVSDHQPIQYTFQAEGRTESIAGSQLLQPFTIHEQYSITEINGAVTITVPTAVLTAVGPQLKALETEPDATPVRPQQTYNQLRSPQVAMAPPTAVPEFAAEVLIPAGEFQMGCDASNSAESCQSEEEPLHTVILNAFSIDKYEVTNVRYQACVDAGRCTPPQRSSSSTRDSYYGTAHYADYPVANVDLEPGNGFLRLGRQAAALGGGMGKGGAGDGRAHLPVGRCNAGRDAAQL